MTNDPPSLEASAVAKGYGGTGRRGRRMTRETRNLNDEIRRKSGIRSPKGRPLGLGDGCGASLGTLSFGFRHSSFGFCCRGFGIGIWGFSGAWSLEFGIFPSVACFLRFGRA